jgi:hypothetical protein
MISKRSPLAVSLGLALLLALGIGVAWAAVVAFRGSMVDDWLSRDREYRNVQVLFDGTPMVWSYLPGDYSARVWHTLDGKKIPDEDRAMGTLPGGYLPGLRQYWEVPRILSWHQRLAILSDYRDRPTYWFFIHSGMWDGSGYFEGFDSKSKLRVGYLGTAGFRDDVPPPDQRFEADGRALACGAAMTGASGQSDIFYGPVVYSDVYSERLGERAPPWASFMVSADRIVRLDVRTGKSEKIMEIPGAYALRLVRRASSPAEEKKRTVWEPRPLLLAVRTADRLIIADTSGKELERYAIPEPLRARSTSFYLLNDRTVLAETTRFHEGGDFVADLRWFDSSARVLRQETVVVREASVLGKPAAEKWVMSAVVPVPIVLAGAVVVNAFQDDSHSAFADALADSWSEMWLAVLLVAVVAIVLAALCYRRQRRYSLPWTPVWVALVFLTGVPGMLGYLFHRRWPVLEPCPTCEKAAPRDREACAHCRAEFARPAPKGTEVFA